MSDERREVLQMLSEGKITTDEAERLLAALEPGVRATSAGSSTDAPWPANRPLPKYLRVTVDTDEPGEDGPTKVNIRVPMQLLRAGVRLTSLIPPAARDEVNAEMRKHGVNFDVNTLKPENLEALVEQLADLEVNVDQEKTKVRVFCE